MQAREYLEKCNQICKDQADICNNCPLTNLGCGAPDSEYEISHCPWCGSAIKGREKASV